MEKKIVPENFLKLAKEKQERILSAGFTAFGESGYDKTSMADIAKLAGVSKSSLFHYFESKNKMYMFLYDFGAQRIAEDIITANFNSDDFFERLVEVQEIKLKTAAKYSGMYEFFYSTIKDNTYFEKEDIGKINHEVMQKGFENLFAGVNWDKFKAGADKEKVINMSTWVSEGHVKIAVAKGEDYDTIITETYEYLDLIKEVLYKEEYLRDGK